MSLWLMDSTLPSTVPDNSYFKAFISMLNYNFKTKSKDTELRVEHAIFGFCFNELKKRLTKSYEYFQAPFMCLETDAWTAENNVTVLGVSATFYDLIKKNVLQFYLVQSL